MVYSLTPKIAFIYNPIAGSLKSSKYVEIFGALIRPKWKFISIRTEKNRVVEQVKSICNEGFSHIIISGGDGTVMEAVNGIIISGRNPVMGIIPQGTGNDLARALGYYKRFKENPLRYFKDIIKNIEYPESRGCHILSINEKIYFTNYLGIGFDAKIAREFQKKRSYPIPNRLIYFLCIIRYIFLKSKGQIDISLKMTNGKEDMISIMDFKNILLINIPSYGGGLMTPEGLHPEEEVFHLIIIKSVPEFLFFFLKGKLPYKTLNALFGRWKPDIYKTSKITIRLPDNRNYIQIDGEDYTERIDSNRNLTINTAGMVNVL